VVIEAPPVNYSISSEPVYTAYEISAIEPSLIEVETEEEMNRNYLKAGFGNYTIGFSQYKGNFAVYNGGGGAVLLNQTFYFGLYGTGLSTRHSVDAFTMKDQYGHALTYNDLRTNFGHGGLWLGYIHQSNKPIHFGASVKLGWGAASLSNDWYSSSQDTYDYYTIGDDHVFVATPEVQVEMNLLRWFKINASAGYQLVSGLDATYIDENGAQQHFFGSNDFNQPVFNISFLFGGFGYKRN